MSWRRQDFRGLHGFMAKKILHAIDRWRFEAPLAALLGVAAGFAVAAMPASIFAQAPVVGGFGLIAQGAAAALIAVLSGVVSYILMRPPARPGIDAATLAEARQEETPAERLHRVHRADRHPDAPPRAPIRASRDLGAPLMEVGLFFQETAGQTETDMILDGEFVELAGELPAPHPAEPDVGETETLDAVEELAETTPVEEEEEAPVVAAAPVAAGARTPLADFAASTSAATMRPCGPEPWMRARSTPASSASRRANGEEMTRLALETRTSSAGATGGGFSSTGRGAELSAGSGALRITSSCWGEVD